LSEFHTGILYSKIQQKMKYYIYLC